MMWPVEIHIFASKLFIFFRKMSCPVDKTLIIYRRMMLLQLRGKPVYLLTLRDCFGQIVGVNPCYS